jgi:hypothetical protein
MLPAAAGQKLAALSKEEKIMSSCIIYAYHYNNA